MYYNLFLDDQRMPLGVTWVELPLVQWTIVRNFDDFVKCIKNQGLPRFISFDHDLCFEHMRDYFEVSPIENQILSPLKLSYDSYKTKTGYHCSEWLVNYCRDNNLDLPDYTVHSMNHIGKRNILTQLGNYKYSRKYEDK